ELQAAIDRFQHHERSGRVRERDHALVNRRGQLEKLPPVASRPFPDDRRDSAQWTRCSPMDTVDQTFVELVQANPHLRPRVGNPDEMRSNRLIRTLEALKFRVTAPEPGIPEGIDGS